MDTADDFPLFATLTQPVYAPGQNATINYTLVFDSMWSGLTTKVYFDILFPDDMSEPVTLLNVTVPNATNSSVAIVTGQFTFNIPANTTSRQAIVLVMAGLRVNTVRTISS